MPISNRHPSFNSPKFSVQLERVSNLITGRLKNMDTGWYAQEIAPRSKAIAALLPYAARREADGEGAMIDAILCFIRASDPQGFTIEPTGTLFDEGSPDSLNRVITLVSPYAPWNHKSSHGSMVTRWATAVLAIPFTEEVEQSIVDTLLQIASNNSLQSYIPTDVWALLKKRPRLPPVCKGQLVGTTWGVVRRARELGDIEILKSYFLLVWSEYATYPEGLTSMQASIMEDFSGIEMGGHRKDLIDQLD